MAEEYSVGEKLFCIFRKRIYEAKCIDVRSKNNNQKPRYLIHYPGWNKSWDEWVTSVRLLKHTKENVTKYKQQLANEKKEDDERASRAKQPSCEPPRVTNQRAIKRKASARSRQSIARKRKTETESANVIGMAEKAPQLPQESPTPKIQIPQQLWMLLDDDKNFVAKQSKLLKLPATVTVENILEKFLSRDNHADLSDMTRGISEYFNVMCGKRLLYGGLERAQYLKVCEKYPDLKMTEIYGAEHLLRLLVCVNNLLPQSECADDELRSILKNVQDFVAFICENITQFFSPRHYVSGDGDIEHTIT